MFSSSSTRGAWAPHSSLQEKTQDQTSGCGSAKRKGKNFPTASWNGCSFKKLQVWAVLCIPLPHTSGIWQLPSGHTECSGWHAEELDSSCVFFMETGVMKWSPATYCVDQSVFLLHSWACDRSGYSCKYARSNIDKKSRGKKIRFIKSTKFMRNNWQQQKLAWLYKVME